MRDFQLDIVDPDSRRIETVRLSGLEVFRLQVEAGDGPASPRIAQWLEEQLVLRGYQVDGGGAQLMEAAQLMLCLDANTVQVRARRGSGPYAGLENKVHEKEALRMVGCRDMIQQRDIIARDLHTRGYVPVFWSALDGLRFDSAATVARLSDFDGGVLKDPLDLFSFIVRVPNPRLAYILEGFHLVLESCGDGALRRELERQFQVMREALSHREEQVVLLAPEDFVYPWPFRGNPPAPAPAPMPAPVSHTLGASSSLLALHGVHLSDPARVNRMKPVVGMEGHVQRLAQILCQMESNNPLLVGCPGVGKTAVVEGLARLMGQGLGPAALRGRSLYSLSLSSLVAGTRYRGDLEERIESLIREVMDLKDRIVIFIDEIHVLVGAGAAEGGFGLSESLKPVLARGEFPCIGATTFEGEAVFIGDKALARRFKRIVVNEPDRDTAVRILGGIANCFEKHHGVVILPEAVAASVDQSILRITDAYLPGKAVSLLDGAASYCALQGGSVVRALDVEAEIDRIQMFSRTD